MKTFFLLFSLLFLVSSVSALTFTNSNSKESTKNNTSTNRIKNIGITIYDIDLSNRVVKKNIKSSFDKHDALTNHKDLVCSFIFYRKFPEWGERTFKRVGIGKLKILNGIVTFLDNSWLTGGIAEPEYLIEDAELLIDKDGYIIGTAPYFYLFDIPKRPVNISIGKDIKSEPLKMNKSKPTGKFYFKVLSGGGDEGFGMFKLKCKY